MQVLLRRVGFRAPLSPKNICSLSCFRFCSQSPSEKDRIKIKVPVINKSPVLYLRDNFVTGKRTRSLPPFLLYIPPIVYGISQVMNGITLMSGVGTVALLIFSSLANNTIKSMRSKIIQAVEIDTDQSRLFLTVFNSAYIASLLKENFKYLDLKTLRELQSPEQYANMEGIYIPKRINNFAERPKAEQVKYMKHLLDFQKNYRRIQIQMEEIKSIDCLNIKKNKMQKDKEKLSFAEFVKKYKNDPIEIQTTIPELIHKGKHIGGKFKTFLLFPNENSAITQQALNYFYAKAYGLDFSIEFNQQAAIQKTDDQNKQENNPEKTEDSKQGNQEQEGNPQNSKK